jgi:2-polyprenyl-3-methyl-5-hydroxy-6-metoxy-1,4-benzoquinol methylase
MADDGARLERERIDADRRYNDALTAFDRALVKSPELVPPAPVEAAAADLPAPPDPVAPPPAPPAPPALPELEPWWRGGRVFAQMRRHVALLFDHQQRVHAQLQQMNERHDRARQEQHAFNAALRDSVARELSAAADRDRASLQAVETLATALRPYLAAFERFESALIVFVQQITGFVESKDRVLQHAGAEHSRFLEAHQRALDALREAVSPIAEIQQQVIVLQRTAQMLKREIEHRVPQVPEVPGVPQVTKVPVAPAAGALDDFTYVGFEDLFRGSDEETREKLRAYVPIFKGASDVLDLGCGRGEFLALLAAEGVSARGADTNYEMVEVVRERGLQATQSDGLSYLESVPDGSLGGLIAAQVVEHLQPSYLVKMLRTAYDKLRPGSPIVIETINPACWFAFFSSYIRDFTHVRPMHPETMQYLLQASGFANVALRYSAPVPEKMKLKRLEMPKNLDIGNSVTARALYDAAIVLNENANALNNLLFTHLDYAAIGYRS